MSHFVMLHQRAKLVVAQPWSVVLSVLNFPPIFKGIHRAHDVEMTSYRCRCDVPTSHRRQWDVITLSSPAGMNIVSKFHSDSLSRLLNQPFKKGVFCLRKDLKTP